jgi:hypothetical protein
VASSAELLPGRFSSALELSSSRLPERAKGNVLFRSVGSGLDLQGSDAMHGIKRRLCSESEVCGSRSRWVDKRNRRDEVPHSSWDFSLAKSKQDSDTRLQVSKNRWVSIGAHQF